MSERILELHDVHIAFRSGFSIFRKRSVAALRGVSMDVRRGETLGVIGRNGAGKTTMLKTLAGIIEPDQGWRTSTVERIPLLSLQLGFISHLSGRDNAILGGMLLGLGRKQMQDRLPAVSEISELGRWLDEPVKVYSAGMKARLGFAVALQSESEILLVDEVLGVGDRDFRDKSAGLIRERIENGAAAVVVSHNPATLRRLCDRAIWIEDGVIEDEGEASVVIDRFELRGRRALRAPEIGA